MVLSANPLSAQTPDTTRTSAVPLFKARDALVMGGFLLGAAALAPLDVHIAGRLQEAGPQANHVLQNTATGFRLLGAPGTAVIGVTLYAAGWFTKRPQLADLGLHTTEAIALGEGVNFLLKGVAGRGRPYLDPDDPFDFQLGRGFASDDFRSFPSGHTVAAFATAASITTEIARGHPEAKWWVGPIL